MNILIDPIFNGLIQTLISVILISGLIFFGKTINNLFFKRYESLLFNFTIIKQSSLKNHVLKRCFGKKIATSNDFVKSLRNPFNRNNIYRVLIYEFNYKKLPNCV